MDRTVRKEKTRQLKKLLQKEPTEGRTKEVHRLAKELDLGPGLRAKIAVWVRCGLEKEG